jgi:AhpD family alkylhydroperoxidase
MNTIQVPTRQQVDAKANSIFDNLESNLGMVPNIYATIGYSSTILEGYLNYAAVISSGVYSKKQEEAIKLAVSEVNNCQYCKAAHTVLAKMNGYTEEETLEIRSGNHKDKNLNTLIQTAQEIAVKRGAISNETKARFFNQGFNEQAFIELIAMVNVVSFTNFIHNATQVPVDFPAAPALLADAA